MPAPRHHPLSPPATPPAATPVPGDLPDAATLSRRLARERAARLEAEAIAERGLRELYSRKEQLQLVTRIASAANQSQSVREVLQYALDEICRFMHWSVGHVYLAEPRRDGSVRLRPMGVWHTDEPEAVALFREATEATELASGDGLPGRVHAARRPEWLFDVGQDEHFPRISAARACGLKAACGFPVMLGEDVAAVLEFFTDRALERDAALVEAMSQIGLQLSRVMERKRAEERLIHDASHDALTGLPNRTLFLDRLDHAIERHRLVEGAQFAVLFIDLDRFKIVNDSLGHLAGDELITEVAARLQAGLRHDAALGPTPAPTVGEATLARLGGDEFTVLLADIRDPSEAVRIANRLQETLRLPFTLNGQEIFTTASIGIASSATGYATAEDILRDADLAMYRAKAMGRARCELFDHELHLAAIKRLTLEADLRRAVLNNEFVLHYQPIVSLRDESIVGFEALLRWQRPDGTLVYPGDFIGLAEETGLIVFLGIWVLREACRFTRALQESHPRRDPLTISVNLSPRQFAQPELVAQIRQIIRETGIDPTTVRLEITETIMAGDAERVIAVLTELKEIGLRISIDDFGTGYSSLSYLHRFPLDVLKIDRSFVSGMEEGGQSLQIVRTIMALAQSLGMAVIAEGTEVVSQVRQLRTLGCEFGQGYYFSRPVAAAKVEALLAASPAPAANLALPAWRDDHLRQIGPLLQPDRTGTE